MDGKINNSLGNIVIPNEVFANIAGVSATHCYGVVGMAAKSAKDGIVNLLKRDVQSKGVKVSLNGDTLSIDLHIVVEYGSNIRTICENVISNVKYSVEDITGFKVLNVNVFVESMKVED